MLALGHRTRVFLATGWTDLRRGFNGLYALVRQQMGEDPLSGHVFVFCNRRRDSVKILAFDGSGLWVCAKRLEAGTFRWPADTSGRVEMDATELAMLLNGVDPGTTRRRKWWRIEKSEAEPKKTADIPP